MHRIVTARTEEGNAFSEYRDRPQGIFVIPAGKGEKAG